jgi:hypothetical protein
MSGPDAMEHARHVQEEAARLRHQAAALVCHP